MRCLKNTRAPLLDNWIRQWICVQGREDWVFVKVHTHGTQESSMPMLLGEPMDRTFSYLERAYNDGSRYALHYVTAREMFNIIKAAEEGKSGDPNAYRDYRLKKGSGGGISVDDFIQPASFKS